MAARATWKGFQKISLVNIPIKVFPATESSGTTSFHQLHGECQTRIQQKRWCPYHNREVPNSEIVKVYEFEEARYVVPSEEDFDKVHPESTRVIALAASEVSRSLIAVTDDHPKRLWHRIMRYVTRNDRPSRAARQRSAVGHWRTPADIPSWGLTSTATDLVERPHLV